MDGGLTSGDSLRFEASSSSASSPALHDRMLDETDVGLQARSRVAGSAWAGIVDPVIGVGLRVVAAPLSVTSGGAMTGVATADLMRPPLPELRAVLS